MARDYKDEYEKFQKHKSSYRAKLNKYNRKKGTYGNGDGKDASHSKGKITGFVESSKNKGKKEKSRLKGSKRKGYKHGGEVDNIPAMLTEGEFVIKKSSAESIGYDKLHEMNNSGKLPKSDARKRRKKNAKSRG
tara:strand:- start:160 stop:561 length:402 start_codon:yes stop_codon:yes gene_type:complete